MNIVAQFEIRHEQFIDERGKALKKLPAFAQKPANMIAMYRMMTLARAFDARAVALQRTGKLGTYPSCFGVEGIHVGTGMAMKPEDVFAPMYREVGTQICRGVKLSEILLYWGGDERGSDFEVPRNDFPWAVPIATQCLHAVGAAMAFKLRKEKRAALTVIGDGSTSEGDFYEAINAAGAYQLPVVFLVLNNRWAISVPLKQQTACETLAQKAIAGGFQGIQVDGNDVVAVRNAVERAMIQARKGGGPALVEALTYRIPDHTTADDASRYRDSDDVEKARDQEPVLRLRRYLTHIGEWDETKETALLEECATQVAAAVDEFKNTPRPTIESMFDYMYAELPDSLVEQRAAALAAGETESAHG